MLSLPPSQPASEVLYQDPRGKGGWSLIFTTQEPAQKQLKEALAIASMLYIRTESWGKSVWLLDCWAATASAFEEEAKRFNGD